jgi:hypothetical protein
MLNGPGVEERGVGMYRFLKKIPPHPAYRGRYLVKEHNPGRNTTRQQGNLSFGKKSSKI